MRAPKATIIIFAAWVRGVDRIAILRMVAYVAIETAVGSLPVVRNLFDIGWRASRRNYDLVVCATRDPADRIQQKGRNWLFIACVCLALAALMAVPMLLFGWILLQPHGPGSRGQAGKTQGCRKDQSGRSAVW